MGILGFGDRLDLKRKLKIGEEKTKTREIEERKIKKMNQKTWQWLGQIKKMNE